MSVVSFQVSFEKFMDKTYFTRQFAPIIYQNNPYGLSQVRNIFNLKTIARKQYLLQHRHFHWIQGRISDYSITPLALVIISGKKYLFNSFSWENINFFTLGMPYYRTLIPGGFFPSFLESWWHNIAPATYKSQKKAFPTTWRIVFFLFRILDYIRFSLFIL